MAISFKLIFLFLTIFINHIHGSASTTKEIDGKCYSFHTGKKGQYGASSACRKEGGKLYEPQNRLTYDKVMRNLGSVTGGLLSSVTLLLTKSSLKI